MHHSDPDAESRNYHIESLSENDLLCRVLLEGAVRDSKRINHPTLCLLQSPRVDTNAPELLPCLLAAAVRRFCDVQPLNNCQKRPQLNWPRKLLTNPVVLRAACCPPAACPSPVLCVCN